MKYINHEELLKEAKARFPKGVKFRSVNNPNSEHFHISQGHFYQYHNGEIICYSTNTGFASATVYKDGKWAKSILNYEIY